MKNKGELFDSTWKVFRECSDIYLHEDKHWGGDLDIIARYAEKFIESNIIELGAGHAWHLANLFFVCSSKLKIVAGIDYSEMMLKKATAYLNSIIYKGQPLSKRIKLQNADILSLPFKEETFDVALLLNNTLGNIPGKTFEDAKIQRKIALSEIKRIIRENGYLIISVYNSDKLTEEDKYGNVFELNFELSDLEKYDLIVSFKPTETNYYSHWFNKKEISNLLYNISFRVVKIEERNKRIIIVSQKKRHNKKNFRY